MNVSEYPLTLKLYKRSYLLLSKLQAFLNAIFAGFWLGVIERQSWQLADGIFYENDTMYQDESWNLSGLYDWEAEIISKYFQSSSKILLAGAGGGREIYALSQQGYQVDGFECNSQFVKYANKFLQKENIDSEVILAPRDTCPSFNRIYNGAIVGWGAYTNIQGKQYRINFLQQMRSHLEPKTPILLSFFPRTKDSDFLKLIYLVGNIIRKLRGKDSIELGDSLFPHHIFVHYFNESEIKDELEQAGFELLFYCDQNYGKAVGISKQ